MELSFLEAASVQKILDVLILKESINNQKTNVQDVWQIMYVTLQLACQKTKGISKYQVVWLSKIYPSPILMNFSTSSSTCSLRICPGNGGIDRSFQSDKRNRSVRLLILSGLMSASLVKEGTIIVARVTSIINYSKKKSK